MSVVLRPALRRSRCEHVLGVAAEQDIGTTAGHVRRDRDRAELTGLRDDLGFAFRGSSRSEVVLMPRLRAG